MGGRISSETTWRRSRLVARGAVPAAGADPSVAVPAGHVYRLRSAYAELTTSATVANRSPRLQVSDGASVFLTIPPVAVITAGLLGRLAYLPSSGGYGAAGAQVMPLIETDLQAGWVVSLVTTAIDVADQWTALALLVDDMTVRGGNDDLIDAPDLRVEIVGTLPS